jgi:hypothetical protein
VGVSEVVCIWELVGVDELDRALEGEVLEKVREFHDAISKSDTTVLGYIVLRGRRKVRGVVAITFSRSIDGFLKFELVDVIPLPTSLKNRPGFKISSGLFGAKFYNDDQIVMLNTRRWVYCRELECLEKILRSELREDKAEEFLDAVYERLHEDDLMDIEDLGYIYATMEALEPYPAIVIIEFVPGPKPAIRLFGIS